jgi:hypothetical protein
MQDSASSRKHSICIRRLRHPPLITRPLAERDALTTDGLFTPHLARDRDHFGMMFSICGIRLARQHHVA